MYLYVAIKGEAENDYIYDINWQRCGGQGIAEG